MGVQELQLWAQAVMEPRLWALDSVTIVSLSFLTRKMKVITVLGFYKVQ